MAHLLHAILFPLLGSEFGWHVSIEASERFRSVHVFQNQMLYYDIVLGAKILEDLTILHVPVLAVNERHIWWICCDMYV